jgi:eukaryotic-like serine/threonine-protein kinase
MEPRGRLLGDRYELPVPLASGGMGRVWRARDTLLQRPVAVKLLRSEFTGDPTFRARFRAEAQHTAVLTHPNIASVFDYGEADVDGEHLAYLVMELVEGEPLSSVLLREGRLDVTRTLSIVRQTAAALAAAHAAGVVHRDVKPGNVLVAPDGHVKITDFGIAWSASSVPLTGTGQVIGTAHYLSPEQAQGGKATPASDVYSLGAVAYECLAGRRPIDGENSVQIAVKQIREEPAPLPPDVPPAVRQLVGRAMAKDPAQRLPDGAALRDAVDALAAGQPTTPLGPGHPAAPLGGSGTAVLPVPPVGAAAGGSGTAVMPVPPVGTAAGPAIPPRSAPPARRSRRGARSLAALLLGVLVIAGLVAVGVAALRTTGDTSGDTAGGTPTPTPPSTTQPALESTTSGPTTSEPPRPQTVAVVADDYVGRPLDEVQGELTGLGLRVQATPVETEEEDSGVVTAVDPAGELTPGTVVAVSYAVAPQQPGAGNGEGNGKDNGKKPKDKKKGDDRGKKDD